MLTEHVVKLFHASSKFFIFVRFNLRVPHKFYKSFNDVILRFKKTITGTRVRQGFFAKNYFTSEFFLNFLYSLTSENFLQRNINKGCIGYPASLIIRHF
jgi:hypothetical protein